MKVSPFVGALTAVKLLQHQRHGWMFAEHVENNPLHSTILIKEMSLSNAAYLITLCYTRRTCSSGGMCGVGEHNSS